MSIKTKAKPLIFILVVALIIFGLWFVLIKNRQESTNSSNSSQSNFDKTLYSLTEPSSLWVIVNKKQPLPQAYEPSPLVAPDVGLRTKNTDPEMKLRDDAAVAVESLVSGAKKAGNELIVVSGFRSYQAQSSVYNSAVRQDGQAEADKYSARPGHSEHQTGLAVDFGLPDRSCELEVCFAETKAGTWLADHAHEYGFVLRYDKDKQSSVGYDYEPWHFRFVGNELAAEVKKTGQTLEEYFGLPPAPSY